MRLFEIVMVLLATTSMVLAAEKLPLVKGGKSEYVIVIVQNASPSQKRGAEEIQKHVADMTGAKLAIVTDDQPARENEIVVGMGSRSQQAKLTPDLKALGNDGFVLNTVGPKVFILGSPVRGTMYGCSEMLERLGVRWYTPKVTVAPKTSDLLFEAANEKQVPAFEYREPYFTEAFDKDWAARNRMLGNSSQLDESTGGKITYAVFVHSFDHLVPPALFEKHPEYFPMVGGKRINGYVQRCLSNPEVLKRMVEGVKQDFRANPQATLTSVSQNDVDKWCTCPECEKLAKQYGGQSGVYVWFVNQVAEQIEKEFPDKLIDTLAYQFTEAPPANIKPRPNVRIRLCPIFCCESHPYEQCTHDANKAYVARLKSWAKLTDVLYIWHYNTDFAHYLMPFADFKQFPESARMYKRNGVKGVFFQGAYAPGGGGSDAELRSYIMAKVLWNVDADTDKLVTEWMDGVYGPAGKPMRQWFDLLHAQYAAPDAHLGIYDPPKAERFTPEVMKKANELFDQAETLAQTDLQKEYLKKSRLWIRYVDLAQHPEKGEKLKQFVADCKAFGIQFISEGQALDAWQAARK